MKKIEKRYTGNGLETTRLPVWFLFMTFYSIMSSLKRSGFLIGQSCDFNYLLCYTIPSYYYRDMIKETRLMNSLNML